MRKPYYKPIIKAFPDIKLPEPFISKFTVFVVGIFLRLYLWLFLGIARFKLNNPARLIDSFNRTLTGKTSTILAFRHPYGGEPQILSWVATYCLRKIARRSGVRFPINSHISFIYGYEVPRWGGSLARWVMPRLKAMPIYHAKMDSAGMARIYRSLEDGPYPMGIAPEGQVTYNSESLPRLEQGVIRIGFQSAINLNKRGNNKNVEILPVSIHLRYGKWAKIKLKIILNKIERATISVQSGRRLKGRKDYTIFQRFEMSRNNLLKINEEFYKIPVDTDRPYDERIENIMQEALSSAERILGIDKIDGDFITQVNHIRQICWDRIYLPGKEKKDLYNMPLAERALADRLAGEAWYAARHMELVDFLYFFRNPIPTQETPFHMVIEYAQNLWDFASRTMGGAYKNRINVHPKTAFIYTGEPIDLSKKLSAYRENRKETIAATIQELDTNFMKCIEDVKKDDLKRNHISF
jgi:hypothetical protein